MIDGLYGPSALAEEHDKGLISGFLLGVLLSCMFIVMAHAIKPHPTPPRLVGYGCEGTLGYAIYANEEDHFPKCLVIKENK